MFADFTMIYEMGKDGKQIVKYKDNGNIKLVISSENGDIEQLIVDKKAYVAMSLGGKEKKYMDFDKISKGMSMFSSAMGDEQNTTSDVKIKMLKKLGDKKIQDSITAEEWEVLVEDGGEKIKDKIVVTKDKRVFNATKEYLKALKRFSGGEDFDKFFILENGYVVVGIEGMQLVNFDTKKVDSSAFKIGPMEIQIENNRSKKQSFDSLKIFGFISLL